MPDARTFIKLHDAFPDHPKIHQVGPAAAWLYVCGLCYCSRWLSDGRIPKGAVAQLSAIRQPAAAARKLVDVGMWDDAGDHYLVHDYLEHQSSKAQVEAKKLARAEAGRKGGSAKRQANGEAKRKQPTPQKSEVQRSDSGLTSPSTPDSTVGNGDGGGAELQALFEAKGHNPSDIAAALERFHLRQSFGEPIKDPVAWLSKVLSSMACVHTDDPGASKVIELDDGTQMQLTPDGWAEVART